MAAAVAAQAEAVLAIQAMLQAMPPPALPLLGLQGLQAPLPVDALPAPGITSLVLASAYFQSDEDEEGGVEQTRAPGSLSALLPGLQRLLLSDCADHNSGSGAPPRCPCPAADAPQRAAAPGDTALRWPTAPVRCAPSSCSAACAM